MSYPSHPTGENAPAASNRTGDRDRFGEELADDATIWHVYDNVAREDDERRTKSWDAGLNNLALFAGLFSAVTTTFIIEAQKDMKPDYTRLTFLILNASTSGREVVQRPFEVTPSARAVNCLWVASLILSLSDALIAVMGKDWVGMYTARPVCNLRQWAEMRTYRLRCVELWFMPGVIAAAPVLLHISLLLFLAGLVLFLSDDALTRRTTLGLSLAVTLLYTVIALSAVVFSSSPFKSPATQMLRTAISGIISHMRIAMRRPKRNLVRTLLRELNLFVVGRADSSTLVSYSADLNQQRHTRRSLSAILTGAGNASVVSLQSLPISLRSAWWRFRVGIQSRLVSLVSAAHRLSVSDWFLTTTWTELPTDPRPELVAEAISWLSGASQAPEVFRSIIFALGDLGIGQEVGQHTSPVLQARLRAEIRRTWQHVDFLLLSRYILADQNSPGDPLLNYQHFTHRFDPSRYPALRCEDGLAAVILVDPTDVAAGDIARYSPAHVTQPRMLQFLLPYMRRTCRELTEDLILMFNLYKKLLLAPGSFSHINLEAHLYQSLDEETRNAYATDSIGKYGRRRGAIELLTFLCCNSNIYDAVKTAAVELAVELLAYPPFNEHRCLAYLFGSSELWRTVWQDTCWSPSSLWWLSECLSPAVLSNTHSDDWDFNFALARSSVMLLSPQHDPFGREDRYIQLLYELLCPSEGIRIQPEEKHDVIGLLLKTAALVRIVRAADSLGHDAVIWGTSILAVVISDLGQHLREDAVVHHEEQLFGALAFTEVTAPNGDTLTWDLGQWLRLQTPVILKHCPLSTTAVQGIHDALCEIYPLCAGSRELSSHWERIGYPGRPGDVFSDPFLDVGLFFATAEARPRRARMSSFFGQFAR